MKPGRLVWHWHSLLKPATTVVLVPPPVVAVSAEPALAIRPESGVPIAPLAGFPLLSLLLLLRRVRGPELRRALFNRPAVRLLLLETQTHLVDDLDRKHGGIRQRDMHGAPLSTDRAPPAECRVAAVLRVT